MRPALHLPKVLKPKVAAKFSGVIAHKIVLKLVRGGYTKT